MFNKPWMREEFLKGAPDNLMLLYSDAYKALEYTVGEEGFDLLYDIEVHTNGTSTTIPYVISHVEDEADLKEESDDTLTVSNGIAVFFGLSPLGSEIFSEEEFGFLSRVGFDDIIVIYLMEKHIYHFNLCTMEASPWGQGRELFFETYDFRLSVTDIFPHNEDLDVAYNESFTRWRKELSERCWGSPEDVRIDAIRRTVTNKKLGSLKKSAEFDRIAENIKRAVSGDSITIQENPSWVGLGYSISPAMTLQGYSNHVCVIEISDESNFGPEGSKSFKRALVYSILGATTVIVVLSTMGAVYYCNTISADASISTSGEEVPYMLGHSIAVDAIFAE